MGLVECPDCRREISDSAPACPNCSRPGARGAVGRGGARERVVVKQKGTTAGGVFGGLFLFFIVMPAFLFLGTCAVCVGGLNSAAPHRAQAKTSSLPAAHAVGPAGGPRDSQVSGSTARAAAEDCAVALKRSGRDGETLEAFR